MTKPLEVTTFRSSWDVPSPSPFCLKLETWLRLADVPFETEQPTGPPKSDSGKLPFAKFPDGSEVQDSSNIIDRAIEVYDVTLDDHLTERQRGETLLIQRTYEEHFYWAIVYQRWLRDDNFEQVKAAFFGKLPRLVRAVLPAKIRRTVKRDAHGHGMSRHSWKDMLVRAEKDLQAVSAILGDEDFFFTKPSSADVVSYAFIESVIGIPIDDELTELVRSFENLCDHTKRVRELVWNP